MDESEFYQHLADMASMENGARMDALDAQKKSAEAASTSNGAKPKRESKAKARVSRRKTKRNKAPADLPCGCKPYVDIKTFAAWREEGQRVPNGGKRAWPRGPACFCRHNVVPIEEPKVEVAA